MFVTAVTHFSGNIFARFFATFLNPFGSILIDGRR